MTLGTYSLSRLIVNCQSKLVCFHHLETTVPWLRRLVAGLSPWRPGFDPGSVHVGFVADEVALAQCFTEYFDFSLSISFQL
jgi:hypothetical protein